MKQTGCKAFTMLCYVSSISLKSFLQKKKCNTSLRVFSSIMYPATGFPILWQRKKEAVILEDYLGELCTLPKYTKPNLEDMLSIQNQYKLKLGSRYKLMLN